MKSSTGGGESEAFLPIRGFWPLFVFRVAEK
jgi:hypothetical protein